MHIFKRKVLYNLCILRFMKELLNSLHILIQRPSLKLVIQQKQKNFKSQIPLKMMFCRYSMNAHFTRIRSMTCCSQDHKHSETASILKTIPV